jgi:outer membrane protein assembly factor BamB
MKVSGKMNTCVFSASSTGTGLKARNKLWLGLLLGTLVALGGCASGDSRPDWAGVKDNTEPAKLVDFKQTAKFEVRWKSDIGDQGPDLLQTALTSDAIYCATGKGRLMRLDRATGKEVWSINTGIVVSGGVSSGDGMVFVGSDKGDVLAYDEDGKLKWKSLVSSEVLSVSQVADGTVMVRSGDGRIAGLNAADGKRVWMYERSTPALVVRSHAGVAIQRGVAFAGFAAGKLSAIRIKDGEVLWETQVSQPRGNTELERISDITSDPVVDDEQVCAVSFQGRTACFDTAQGNQLWSRDISSYTGMTVYSKYLYLSDSSGSVISLDKTNGGMTWKNSDLLYRRLTAPYASGKFVVVGDLDGYLHALNIDDGSFAARIKLDGGAIVATPMEMDDGLLVRTRGGELYSLSIK